MTVIDEIAAERQRQITAEGYSPAHDDQHYQNEIAKAAAAYALGKDVVTNITGERHIRLWPWEQEFWKPKTRREDLIRAGALIVAEIERLDRAALSVEGDG